MTQLRALTGLVARAVRIGAPRPISTEQRLRNIPLAGLPVSAPVRIFWDPHAVPSIEAADMHDLAAGLGVVHAHLRLAQMEVMRRLATGRVAEIAGPVAVELDRALRLMGFARIAPAVAALLPEPTRRWAEGFLVGINHVIIRAPALPHEFALLNFRPEPWTLQELLAVGRLAGTDVSWLVFSRLLRTQAGLSGPALDALWPLMQQGDMAPIPEDALERAFGLVRGSNSAVVPAARSATGAGLIASDPHLAIALPPLWLIAGLHAPGFDAAGLMLPALPFIAEGRNRDIAWGGTNLHAASSDLVDVSGETITERVETIAVRGAAQVELRLRETRFGPVVSDGLLLRSERPLSLRWVGQRPSDEITAMLGVMHARSLEEFREALRSFAVPGQTMLAVEAGPRGRAGRVVAAHLPRRAETSSAGLVTAPDDVWSLGDLVPGVDIFAVGEETLVSANDRPGASPVPVGFFFSMPDRAKRLRSLLAGDAITLAAMMSLQRDVTQANSLPLRDALLARVPALPRRQVDALAALRAWDGCYDADSPGALVFEVLVASLTQRVVPEAHLGVLSAVWSGRGLVAQRVAGATPADIASAFRPAARALRHYRSWGGAHRLALQHPLANLPLVGRRYRTRERPTGGSNDTLNCTGHGPVTGRHRVSFGSCARHVSDLADPDANWFVLLGGQDGWLGSANATDQARLWRAGRYITVKLQPGPALHRTELGP